MKDNLVDWFLDHQLKLAFILGFICLVVIFLTKFNVLHALIFFLFSMLFIFAGSKLYSTETSESWLKLSYFQILKSVIGGSFMLIGWALLVRGILVSAVAALILKTS